ncbi:putative chromophore lyase CpcT/CpeT [Helianthus annuus]|nr:putative chromophore lyase CpcT/CpeT [Helianthus annuus]KAJ0745863.1 putative chromophore lyase CpcT/CpeT [Helianthus annuus]
MNLYMNLFRWLCCPAADMVDGSKVLYFEQAFWRTPHKPFRQRFCTVKPCPKEMKCDVERCIY